VSLWRGGPSQITPHLDDNVCRVGKISFLSFTAEVITPAHLRLISEAAGLGNVTVGLMTDEALWGKRALPVLTYSERAELLQSIRGVSHVVPQTSWAYRPILEKIRPHFFLHGNLWDSENSSMEVEQILSGWGGQLLEVPFEAQLAWLEPSHRSSKISSVGSNFEAPSSDSRRASLGRALRFDRPVLALEAHNALSAMVAESAAYEDRDSGQLIGFDALWSSSLTDSSSRGYPDIEALSFDARLANIREIFRVSSKPMIMDLDTGGEAEILALRVRELERAGVSAGVVEDKVGLKKNSLLGNDVIQTQAPIEEFCRKIKVAKQAQLSRDFLLVARVESLILDSGMRDAIERSHSYVESGANAIMIHSRHSDPTEIFNFLEEFRSTDSETPVVLVPTSYSGVTRDELCRRGANLIIYANHLLRAAVPAMKNAAAGILEHGRTHEIESELLSIPEILRLIPGTD
jgi:phosphoenolpyruvate phosphomutase / 2-hydroxyethylphosphonate cytidylyltransferase